MEPWKLAAIAALGVGIIGFGMFTNSPSNATPNFGGTGNATVNPPGATPTPGPPAVFAKYMGTTLPAWPSITQWANTPAPVSLASFKGKPVLLEVFRINCSHCQAAAPFVAALHARYAPRGVAFVAVQSPGDTTDPTNPESNWAGVQTWIKQRGYTWPVGFDANSTWFQGKFGKSVYYPALFLFDKNGKAVFIQSGHDDNKAVQLATELEHIAPGSGDDNVLANELARFILTQVQDNTPGSQASLSANILGRLKALK